MQPPPSPTMVPSRPIRRARQSRSSTAIPLAGSPGGTSWQAMSRSPSASCAVTPWMPATFASATISTAPLPGTSSSSRSIAPIRTSIAAAARTTPSGSYAFGVSVRDLLVDRQPVAIERVERLLVDRKRSLALSSPLPGGRRIDLEQHGECTSGELRPRAGREHRATAESDHRGLWAIENRGGHGLLDRPEARLAVAGKDVLDRCARLALDLVIEVDEGPGEPARHLTPIVVLPAPMNPARARWRPRAFAAIGCARRRRDVLRRSPRARRRRTCPWHCRRAPRNRCLCHDGEGFNGLDIRALDERLRRLSRAQVDRVEGLHQRG